MIHVVLKQYQYLIILWKGFTGEKSLAIEHRNKVCLAIDCSLQR